MRFGTASLASFVTVAAGLMLTACPGPQYPACESDDDCKSNAEGNPIDEYCVNKTCQECREDAHCDEGEECNNGRCEVKPECMTDGDCPEGQLCRLDKCVEVECTGNEDCPAGEICEADECVPGSGSDISSACQPMDPASGDVIQLETVNFDFNESDLRPDARTALEQNAECLNEAEGVEIVIEGHCDERGTQEYNLALGERRANAVKSYLRNLGIGGSRMRTVSKGKNEPVCYENTESCWARNRRVEFIQKRGSF